MTELFKYFIGEIPKTTHIHYGYQVNINKDLPDNIRILSDQFFNDIQNIRKMKPNIDQYVNLWIDHGRFNFQVLREFKLMDYIEKTVDGNISRSYYLNPGLIDLESPVIIGENDMHVGFVKDYLGEHLITGLANLPV